MLVDRLVAADIHCIAVLETLRRAFVVSLVLLVALLGHLERTEQQDHHQQRSQDDCRGHRR